MFNKFFKFLKGYVIIEVTGSDVERFVNICIRRGIDVGDIKMLSDGTTVLCIGASDFMLLRPITWKTKVKIKILERHGFFELKKHYSGRYVLFTGAVLTIVFFAVMSQFVWVVKIDGVYEGDKEQIIQILEENGIKAGVSKRSLPEISDVKKALITRTETVSWAWVYIEGACARVEIYEKRLKPEAVDKSKPCDIVAASDGFIKRIDVRKGEKLVLPDMVVSAGDVLISGKVPIYKEGYEERYMYVHAEGDIEAVTYHTAQKEQKLYHETRIKTGREKKYYSLEFFGKLFKLFFKESISYDVYDEENERHEAVLPFFGYMGICLNEKTYSEVEVYKEPVTDEAAALLAQNELEEQIAKELFEVSELIDRKLEWENVNDDTINVTLKMTFKENIGTENLINKE